MEGDAHYPESQVTPRIEAHDPEYIELGEEDADHLVQELLKDHAVNTEQSLKERIVPDEAISVMNVGPYEVQYPAKVPSEIKNERTKFMFQRTNQRGQQPIIEEVSWSQTSQNDSEIRNQKGSKISHIAPRTNSQDGSMIFHTSFTGSQDKVFKESRASANHNQSNHQSSEYQPGLVRSKSPISKGDMKEAGYPRGYNSVGGSKADVHLFNYSSQAQKNSQQGPDPLIVEFRPSMRPSKPSGIQAPSLKQYYNYLESLIGGLPTSQPLMTRAAQPAKTTAHPLSLKKVKEALGRTPPQQTRKQSTRKSRRPASPHLFYEELDKDYETPVECLDLDTAPQDGREPDSDDYGGDTKNKRRKIKNKAAKKVDIGKVRRFVEGVQNQKESVANSIKKVKVTTKSNIRPDDWKDERFQAAFRSNSKQAPEHTVNSRSKEVRPELKTPQKSIPVSTMTSGQKSLHLPQDMSPSSLNKHLRKEKERRLREQEMKVKELEELDRRRRVEEEEREKKKKDEERKLRVLNLSKKKTEEEEKLKKLKLEQKMQIEQAKKSRKEQQEHLLARNEKEREIRRMSKGHITGIAELGRPRTSSENSSQDEAQTQREPLTQNINLSLVPIAETGGSENQTSSKEAPYQSERKDAIMIEDFNSQPQPEPEHSQTVPQNEPENAEPQNIDESHVIDQMTRSVLAIHQSPDQFRVADSLAFSADFGNTDGQVQESDTPFVMSEIQQTFLPIQRVQDGMEGTDHPSIAISNREIVDAVDSCLDLTTNLESALSIRVAKPDVALDLGTLKLSHPIISLEPIPLATFDQTEAENDLDQPNPLDIFKTSQTLVSNQVEITEPVPAAGPEPPVAEPIVQEDSSQPEEELILDEQPE